MPELPEVETIRRGVEPLLRGRTILKISHSGKQLRSPVPVKEMNTCLISHSIVRVNRRAKYLLVEMSNGSLLIIHLGMTGNLGVFDTQTEPNKHCHLRLLLDNKKELRYTDVRRFGSMHVVHPSEVADLEQNFFNTTGPEPFDKRFTGDYLYSLAKTRSLTLKQFIMTNQVVAGVGNIYANESLFQAGILPKARVNRISKKRWQEIIVAIQNVLSHAIECGGSTISDYVNATQEQGYFQINFQVYGRDGKPCNRCGGTIQKEQLGGRASYFCPSCQER